MRGYLWLKLLETGDFATIEEIVQAENINASCVSRLAAHDAAGAKDRGDDTGWKTA